MIDREGERTFDDFLNSFLYYLSEVHGNYYARWSGFEHQINIVDQDEQKCTNQSIYQELKKKFVNMVMSLLIR